MVRRVVFLGHDAFLATTLRTLLDPDDRLAEVDGVDGWQDIRQDEIDAVVVDLPSTVRLQAVEDVRSTYGGRLILLDPADNPVSVPNEYDCLVIKRPDVQALWNLAANGLGSPSLPSEAADAGLALDPDSAPAPTGQEPADNSTPELAEAGQEPPWMWRSHRYHPTDPTEPAPVPGEPTHAEESGAPTPKGQPPSVPLLSSNPEDQSTDWDSIQVEEISGRRPVILDASTIDQPLPPALLQAYDGDLPQFAAVEIAERLRADIIVLLLDNGMGVMEVFGAVGVSPVDWRLSVEYSRDIMRELSRTSVELIEDTNKARQDLDGIPGSQAETLLMTALVHDHSWIGVLIAGRNRGQAAVPNGGFTDEDVRTLIAVADAVSPSLDGVILLRRLEWELKAGNNSAPAEPGPATVAEASGGNTVPAPMPSPGLWSTLPVEAAGSALSKQDVPAQAAQSDGAADIGRAAPMLLGYLSTLAVIELAGSSPLVSVPVAAASYGLLALLLCLALRVTGDQRVALLLPPLVAVSIVRLVTLAALPGDVRPLLRLVVVGVPALVAIAIAARQRSPAWSLLQPHTGGWPGQLLVALVGVPSALFVWAIAAPAVQVRGDASTMTAAVVLVIFAALPEELLFRGLLVPAAVDVVGGWGIPFAAAVYALAFLNGGSIRTVLLAFLLGVVLGWCRQMTGSVVGVIGAHGLLNIIVFLLLPAPGI
jgi:membrane protease YdiL (CAAX protease family)